MSNPSESSGVFWSAIQDLAFQVLQIVDVRLALLIGVVAFMVAVGFDSSGNPAAAADLANPSTPLPVSVALPLNSGAQGDATLATAQRLRHGGLTSAILTGNRLTEAHFFTDVPR